MKRKPERKLITFDWAMKRLLRSKANFEILEGFLSELLNEEIIILELLESESNKENFVDKFNRVDLKVKNSSGEIIIIEIQHEREYDYLQRMLYGASRAITEHLNSGDKFSALVKVISVNILYFDLGQGSDYIYRGATSFIGIHNHEKLQLNRRQQQLYGKEQIDQLFPEYYLIRINNFNDVATNSLDEWIYFLKNEEIKDNFKAKGIQKAKKAFSVMNMSENERLAYDRYQYELSYQASIVESNYGLGRLEGWEEGREKGLEEGREKGLEEGREKGREEGREKGLEEGKEKGLEEGREKGLEEGREKGREEGREKGREEGNEKGMKKGRAEGEKRKALDVAFRMKQMGTAFEDVMAITGLTREEVETATSQAPAP